MIALPLSLTLLRLLLGSVALLLTTRECPRSGYLVILGAGLLSDYFDGVLARRLGVVRPWYRRLDSATDVVFYLCLLGAACRLEPGVMRRGAWAIGLLLASEALCLAVSYGRFRVYPATHCWLAKCYGLALFATFVAVLGWGSGAWVFTVLAAIGLTANAEVVAILLLARTPPVDVPSVFHLRRGR